LGVGVLNVNLFQRGGLSGQLSEEIIALVLTKQVQTVHWPSKWRGHFWQIA
jgi:hypothetical protein